MQGTVVSVEVAEGDLVRSGTPVLILEAMKMEHVVRAGEPGIVRALATAPGDTVAEGAPLLFAEPAEADGDHAAEDAGTDLGLIRADLAEALRRHGTGLDAARPEAVAKRHARGHRTARENIGDLCDAGTFAEYGALAIAAQRRRRSLDDLIERTPRTAWSAASGRSTARRRSSCPTTTRSWPGRRATRTTARPTGCSTSRTAAGCRWCCSPRAAGAAR